VQVIIAVALCVGFYLLIYYPGAIWMGDWIIEKLSTPTGGESDEENRIRKEVRESIQDSIPEDSGIFLRIVVKTVSFYLLGYYPATSPLCGKLIARLSKE